MCVCDIVDKQPPKPLMSTPSDTEASTTPSITITASSTGEAGKIFVF